MEAYRAEAKQYFDEIMAETHGDAKQVRAEINRLSQAVASTGTAVNIYIMSLVITMLCAYWIELPA